MRLGRQQAVHILAVAAAVVLAVSPASAQVPQPEEALRLAARAGELQAEGRTEEAMSLLRRALAIDSATAGTGHRDYAARLNNLAVLYRDRGRWAEAEPLFREVLAVIGALVGAQHRDYAAGLSNLAVLYRDQGRWSEAEPMFREALAVDSATVGTRHTSYAIHLKNLASLYQDLGRWAEAVALLREVLAVDSATVGTRHPSYAVSLNNLASAYQAQGRLSEAERLYREVLAVDSVTVGTRHATHAIHLNNLAILQQDQGRWAEAERLFREVLVVDSATVGTGHPSYATHLNNLAALYRDQGRWGEAERMYREVVSVVRATAGMQHPSYAATVSNLADLYEAQGRWAEAERLFREVLAVDSVTVGVRHPNYAIHVGNLATLFRNLGRWEEAERLYGEALAVDSVTVGTRHIRYATHLNNMASLYKDLGRWAEAERLYGEVLDVLAAAVGTRHTRYAASLNNLALVYLGQGRRNEAQRLVLEALAVDSATVGTRHPDYAHRLNNLAVLYEREGRWEEAERVYSEALAVDSATVGTGHPSYAIRLANLAGLHGALEQWPRALTLSGEALGVQQRLIEEVFRFSSERAMREFVATLGSSLDVYLSLSRASGEPAAVRKAFAWQLRRKAVVLDALRRYRESQGLLEGDTGFAAMWAEYQGVRDRTARLTLGARVGADTLEALSRRRRELEAALHRRLSAALGEERRSEEAVTVEAVRARLPAGAALVEVVRYRPRRFEATGSAARWERPRYAAFVLRREGEVALVDLGEAALLDVEVAEFRFALEHPATVRAAEAELEAGFRETARELYRSAFVPLARHLASVTRVYVVPDGELSVVPFEALVDESGCYLQERHEFVYLTSGRDLLRREVERPGAGVVVFADPDFGAEGADRRARAEELGVVTRASARREAGDSSLLQWDRLPATQDEADTVRAILTGREEFEPLQVLRGIDALEEVLKSSVRRPRVLHLATHGYFEERGEAWECDPHGWEVLFERPGAGTEVRLRRAACLDDPMLRAGVVLAGANQQPADGVEDGWVTAEELALLDLQGTELVVLSACETGRGQVAVGEGVYGLRRALEVAGTRTVLMTLHRVPDEATQALVGRFYRLWADEGLGKLEALQRSRLEEIELRRAEHGAAHPFYWAGFILQGEPD